MTEAKKAAARTRTRSTSQTDVHTKTQTRAYIRSSTHRSDASHWLLLIKFLRRSITAACFKVYRWTTYNWLWLSQTNIRTRPGVSNRSSETSLKFIKNKWTKPMCLKHVCAFIARVRPSLMRESLIQGLATPFVPLTAPLVDALSSASVSSWSSSDRSASSTEYSGAAFTIEPMSSGLRNGNRLCSGWSHGLYVGLLSRFQLS